MNIDAESIALLSLILRDAPEDRQFILCVLARSNQVPGQIKFHSNTEYPTFYGYSNERMPYFLMGKGVLGNVPREGHAKRLISSYYLSYAETVINKAKNWDINQKLWSVSKFITLDNKTAYKDAEVFLVFRDKAQDYIKDYVSQNQGQISGFLKSKVGRFDFGSKLLNQKEELPEDKSGNLKKRYDQLLKEIRQPKKQPNDLKKRYEETIAKIRSSKPKVNPSQKKTSFRFDKNKGVLTMNKQEVKFAESGRKIPYLELLIKKKTYIYHSEAAEEIEGASNTLKNPKSTYYEVCRGIKTRLLASGITDFLEFDYNKARINPLYKKSTK